MESVTHVCLIWKVKAPGTTPCPYKFTHRWCQQLTHAGPAWGIQTGDMCQMGSTFIVTTPSLPLKKKKKKKPPKLANPHLICLLNPASLSKQYSMFTTAQTAMSQNIQCSNDLISKCVYSYVIYKYWLLCPANVDWKDSKASKNIFETSCFSLQCAVKTTEMGLSVLQARAWALR